ncbi:Pyruvate-formate lyase-activating enzyme [Desulfonispora thiosulfatigenes DSM 11270]|uniref:Pyruvate-formate lyase-activating enzyme n=1 Tax=Desulfonispora thiosulfatigenes DSM 11270 TaxID=656914 RepID=A0A1W1V3Z4_DESTI|nr:radical SAM protein [Desulfonispora thiosulfatigenes]SMB88119.1 Pyruvate-formate lyase-activating enzyme [Desulfonispora thiosulfatigenes DSM 11270]
MFHFVYADDEGNAYNHPNLLAVARLGASFVEPTEEELIPLPEGASLTMIPNRTPIVMDIEGNFKKYTKTGWAVGALLPQGYTRTLLPAFVNDNAKPTLPLFGYSMVAFKDGEFYVAAKLTDEDDKWNPRHFNTADLAQRVKKLTDKFPDNRIIKQIGHCSLTYGCFTAQNIFYNRWEGGIPVSPVCNANCLGCISLQPSECCPSPQQRINFRPTVNEVVEIGLNHLISSDSIISFGQGCEGEPSLQADLISEAIKKIREKTLSGTINMNTNAGYTEGIEKICKSKIDSLRVSLNSANPKMYDSYYRPNNYDFENVRKSLLIANENNVYTYLNLLSFPGINDTEEEIEHLLNLVRETGVRSIQIRNLNIDPDFFLKQIPLPESEALGVPTFLKILKDELPGVEIGNYTKPTRD